MKNNYFSKEELSCRHCGEYKFDEGFLELLNGIREECGFPLPVTSGYRCPKHPIEAAKKRPGAHSSGRAVDIKVSGERAHKLVSVALAMGVPRIGVKQKSGSEIYDRFIHLDWDITLPGPAIWSY